jgi:nucleoside-diphosphate-sugar epimerase
MNVTVKCLITGGAGFIGSNLSEALLEKGYIVYCLDNLITGNIRNIKSFERNSNFHFIRHNVSTPLTKNQLKIFDNVKYIYHLASPASPPKYQKFSIETLLVNSVGTYNMLQLAKRIKANFLLASTSEVYGNPLQHPQKESYFGNVNPNGIRSCYDESKRFAEALTMEYFRKYKINCRIVRIFNTYGPKMEANDGRVISNFINQALRDKKLTIYGDGGQTRSFCYVSDMVSALILVMEGKDIDGEVFNLGNPDEKTVKEIGKIILKLLDKNNLGFQEFDLPGDDPLRRKPDITKIYKLLGWKPAISLRQGLQSTINYFREI